MEVVLHENKSFFYTNEGVVSNRYWYLTLKIENIIFNLKGFKHFVHIIVSNNSNMFPYFEKDHLGKVCMSYVEHVLLSLKLCICFFLGGICAYIHAFIPDMFPKSSSYFSEYIANEIKQNGCKHEQKNAKNTSTNENDSLYKED